jgi:hypothetical protein
MKAFLLNLLLLCVLNANAQDVYKTPSGKKYPLASCRTANNVSEKITSGKALELNLQPCKICQPVVSPTHLEAKTQVAKGESITVQCKGITKSGTRCKHMTSNANGYCFQHNPDN